MYKVSIQSSNSQNNITTPQSFDDPIRNRGDFLRESIRVGDTLSLAYLSQFTVADINSKGRGGVDALKYAIRTCIFSTVGLLVSNGADVHAQDNMGANSLVAAVLKEYPNICTGKNRDRTHIIEFLKAQYASLDDLKVDPIGVENDPLLDCGLNELMRRSGNDDVYNMRLLLLAGADINAVSNDGNTPLNYAILYGAYEAVDFLLDQGAATSIKNDKGETALMIAAASCDRKMVRCFIGRDMLIHETNEENKTSIMAAAVTKEPCLIGDIWEYFASENMRDAVNKAVFQYPMRQVFNFGNALMRISSGFDSRRLDQSCLQEIDENADGNDSRYIIDFITGVEVHGLNPMGYVSRYNLPIKLAAKIVDVSLVIAYKIQESNDRLMGGGLRAE